MTLVLQVTISVPTEKGSLMNDTCKKCVIKDWCDMVVENGKIIEMTEDELYCTYLDRDLAMCMDFNEYKTRMIAAGTKIVRCEK